MRDRVVIACISGFGGLEPPGNDSMLQLRDYLRDELRGLVNTDNIFQRNWNEASPNNPSATPLISDLLNEINQRSQSPCYLAIIGHSFGGWAASRLSRKTSRIPDFIGLIDPVFGPANIVLPEEDHPRGYVGRIINWFQNNGINHVSSLIPLGPWQSSVATCSGSTLIPCSSPQSGIACGNQLVPGAYPIHEFVIKDFNGKNVPCSPQYPFTPEIATHANLPYSRYIWRQIRDRIVQDLQNITNCP